MSSPELDRLIVEHIADLDSAATRIDLIEERIWKAHAEALEDWSRAMGWGGDFDIEDDLIAAPAHWEVDESKQAWFEIDFGPEDDELGLHFNLMRLTGAGGRVCLRFGYNGLRKPWKAAARQHAEALQQFGFVMTPYADFYTDCTPVFTNMIEAVESGDFSPATDPLRAALDRAKAAEPTFTAILKQLKAI
ncbi:hypothetical protein SH203_01567 [Brevundimonas sp. SH203]|uniref:hypothetical protein n=1 Tax=Brevundimonas sp. SH203 TaxID=345167 RepID=UPI0009C7B81A|nr:hypothetical protein [Brevundimonas sp. SH203]GAW41164.1 hypothetical protein SH203_01567 [Brevundimonas sp. SH203]